MTIDEMLEAIQKHYDWDRQGAYAFFTGMVSAVLTTEQMHTLTETIVGLDK